MCGHLWQRWGPKDKLLTELREIVKFINNFGSNHYMGKAVIALMALALVFIASSASASYFYPYGGSYSALHYPNSYYQLSYNQWAYDSPYVYVSRGSYSPYHSYSFSSSGCYNYWCYYPAPNYYQPYYTYYQYPQYNYNPGFYFGINW